MGFNEKQMGSKGRATMIRKIIHIDEGKCTGCGLCVGACHEGAIGMVGGKAKLLRDDFCDGLGDCLPACPADAISFVEREATAYNEAAVLASKQQNPAPRAVEVPLPGATAHSHVTGSCPSSRSREIRHEPASANPSAKAAGPAAENHGASAPASVSELQNWPVQIKLAPIQAPYFDGADLLIAADCCAYAYGSFHHDFIRGKKCLIGCPKLDNIDYSEKLAAIIAQNNVQSVSITRMEVPCCGGLENMAKRALQASGKSIPCQVTTFSLDGRILE